MSFNRQPPKSRDRSFSIGPTFPSRSIIIATIVLTLISGSAYLLYAANEKQALVQQQAAEKQRVQEQRLMQEREKREAEVRDRKAAEIAWLRREGVKAQDEWEAERKAKAAKQAAKELQERTERLKQRSEDAKRAIASLTLVNEAVQTIRPFAFVGTRAQENAPEILRYVGNACNKIQTAQSAPCIDPLKTAAGNYCEGAKQVAQQSVTNPNFFSSNDARLRLHVWIRDNGYQYDAAFNSCQAFLEKERTAIKQENDELNKLRNAGG